MKIGTEMLTYNKASKKFVTEASTIEGHFGFLPEFVTIVSKITRTEVRYALDGQVRNDEGELISFVYRPKASELARVPGCRGTQLIVFNT
jgi:hypothetical protein